MGFGDSPWVAYRHDDTDHTHIHIVASRVQFDGQAVDVWRDYTRGEQLCRELEEKYELTKAPGSESRMRKAPSRAELEIYERTGEKSVRMDIGDRVEQATRESETVEEWVENLGDRGIEVKTHWNDEGSPDGVEYIRTSDGERMKGSDIGRGFSWEGVRERMGVEYVEERGKACLEEANQRAVERLEEK
jgi:hypothetical protein